MDSWLARITINPQIRHGQPVKSMLKYLAGSDAMADLLAEFPDLEREDFLACLKFSTKPSQH